MSLRRFLRVSSAVLLLLGLAMAGTLIDRHPAAARHARELTRIAIAGSG